MSSARANASARNRRAGGDMPPPPQMQGRPGQPMQQQQQMQMPAKLSVSDAIALITLRLGRVEQIVQNMPVDGQSNVSADGENIRIVDNEVFEHMAQRLDELEKVQQELVARKPVVNSAPTQVVNTVVSKEVSESIEVLKAEMVQVKDLLLNLQSFTMQTNQRLSEIVFNGGDFIETLDDTDGIISGNIVDDATQGQVEEVNVPTSLDESS
jgi:hypothetical protein